ncbi:hypothetical protein LWI29_008670 [Acer saccharum]|uniref:Serine-threonine/tyrosine-protein kinase catalytic domain-containing protein n=1 Tax=Acer saccharum TaxID=4024 RepID=A0AA39VYZ6_ACESA|nr:hypothetical protein LWI29_008670 [Acer saccharum]
MPNGSLDSHLFSKKGLLAWFVRYKISLGLASALLYLHEEWEQYVANGPWVGNLGPKTTGLARTLGYLALEYISTGRASKESDVYSFGVVALEIATGKKSAGPMKEDPGMGLVEWVWDLYGIGQVLSRVDEKLDTNFDEQQMECLMIVGLWCAHPDSNFRPSIWQAIQVLNFETAMPNLPNKMPVPTPSSVSFSEPFVTNSSIDVGR